MNTMNTFRAGLTALALTAVACAPAAQAQSVNINFTNGNHNLAATAVAGVVPSAHYNNLGTGTSTPLMDINGATTTVTAAVSGGYGYDNPTFDSTVDSALMASNVEKVDTVTVSGLAATDTYDVYAYFADYNSYAQDSYTIGGQTVYANLSRYGGSFTQVTGGSANAPASGNYALFSGVTGPSFTLTAATLRDKTHLNGLQIVDMSAPAAPEPSQTAALGVGVLGLAGLILARRKRHAA